MLNFTLYTANCVGMSGNCLYPNKVVVKDKESFKEAIKKDHVTARYKGNYRSSKNFQCSDCIPLDCDNDHSDNPKDWVTPFDIAMEIPGVAFAVSYSRHHNLPKYNKSARPRFHIFFPIEAISDEKEYSELKKRIASTFPYFDTNALDSARFLFGSENADVEFYKGDKSIVDYLEESEFAELDVKAPIYTGGSITEGSRNNTMSHFAGRVLKKFGDTDKAYKLYMERADKCEPPLSKSELDAIWNSALKFVKKIQGQDGYIPPEKFNDDFGKGGLKPDDYSDIGEAKVLAREKADCLRYTNATGFLTYCGDCWHEDTQKAIGVTENFLDMQLADAKESVKNAEEALISTGVTKELINSGGRALEKSISSSNMGLLNAYLSAKDYHRFVMKYRNYKNIVNTQNAVKPMLAIDVSELDYDAELLNTPTYTYDLTKGMSGGHTHDPDDLITKVTKCSPGDEGMDLWLDTLNTFFCNDKELIQYVQEIVGMSAIGKVYAEHLIIAYGGGANGKSTFWNT